MVVACCILCLAQEYHILCVSIRVRATYPLSKEVEVFHPGLSNRKNRGEVAQRDYYLHETLTQPALQRPFM